MKSWIFRSAGSVCVQFIRTEKFKVSDQLFFFIYFLFKTDTDKTGSSVNLKSDNRLKNEKGDSNQPEHPEYENQMLFIFPILLWFSALSVEPISFLLYLI